VLAVTACSPTYPEHEKDQAAAIARRIGARHEFINLMNWRTCPSGEPA
jgi:PP-loop superfamily ATP-utilizing enzyme